MVSRGRLSRRLLGKRNECTDLVQRVLPGVSLQPSDRCARSPPARKARAPLRARIERDLSDPSVLRVEQGLTYERPLLVAGSPVPGAGWLTDRVVVGEDVQRTYGFELDPPLTKVA